MLQHNLVLTHRENDYHTIHYARNFDTEPKSCALLREALVTLVTVSKEIVCCCLFVVIHRFFGVSCSNISTGVSHLLTDVLTQGSVFAVFDHKGISFKSSYW